VCVNCGYQIVASPGRAYRKRRIRDIQDRLNAWGFGLFLVATLVVAFVSSSGVGGVLVVALVVAFLLLAFSG
jgi:hypothetical protein